MALDLGQGLRALLTHAGLSFKHRRLQIGHFSCQAGQIGFKIVVHHLGLGRGVGHGSVSVSLNTLQRIGGAFQAGLSFSFGAHGIWHRLLGIVTAGLQCIVQRSSGIVQMGDAGRVVLGAGMQVIIGLRELVLLGLCGGGRALGVVERGLQRRLGFITQGLHLGLKAVDIHACLLGHAPRSLQQLLGHRRQARQLSIHMRQGLLQPFVKAGVLGLYRCQGLRDHGLGLLQSDFNFGLGLVKHFVQCSATFVQRRVDLNKRLV